VDTQQVLALLDQVAIPVFVFFQGPPDRVLYDWRFIRKMALPFPRVQCHGSPLIDARGIVHILIGQIDSGRRLNSHYQNLFETPSKYTPLKKLLF
jgi:hypothetical protein